MGSEPLVLREDLGFCHRGGTREAVFPSCVIEVISASDPIVGYLP